MLYFETFIDNLSSEINTKMPPRKRLSDTDDELSKSSDKKKKKIDEKIPVKNVRKKKCKEDNHSQAGSNANDDKNFVASSEKRDSPKTVTKSPAKKSEKFVKKDEIMSINDINELDVNRLLALGENFKTSGFIARASDSDFSDSDDDDFEEVKNSELKTPQIPKEGVSVVLEMPLKKKKSKGGFDAEAHIKREINRVKKGIQLLMHQVHVLCWIAHMKFVNNTLNSPSLMETCIVLVKSKNLYPSKYADISYLEGILKWFHKTFELQIGSVAEPQCNGNFLNQMIYQIENKKVYSSRDFTLIFVTLLRILGMKARIIMSFQVLPIKPPSSELLSNKTGKEMAKEGTSKTIDSEGKNINGPIIKNEDAGMSKISRKSLNQGSSNQNTKPLKKVNTKSCENISENESSKKSSKEDKDLKPKGKSSAKMSRTSKGKITSKATTSVVTEHEKSIEILINLSDDENEDQDFKIDSLMKQSKKKQGRKSTSSNEDTSTVKSRGGSDVWAEVFVEAEEKWISVDVPKKKIHCINELYSRATHPVLYVIAGNNDLTLKDVTKRYVPHWHSDTKKKRVDEEWWNETMKPYLPPKTAIDKEEDEDIARQLQDQPLPMVISEYKDHPLYALKRHLLKFEAIYPPDAPTLGFVRGEPVYARECVHTLHSREMWYKQARVVRLKEEPYKIVKARPKYDKMTGEIKKDLPLELFGKWQTEDYIPPIAVDGKVPRNEYGNVDLFKPCMLPGGTVHIQIPALNKVARRLGIDCAPATVGFDFHSGGSHPVFDGFVVCEEFKDILLDTWNKELDESAKKNEEKKEKRVYSNWKRLIRGLLLREKLKLKYAFGEESQEQGSSSTSTSTVN